MTSKLTPRIDPAFKAKWIAALRSGEYSQGRRNLRSGDSFCCLGVACDLIGPSCWEEGDDENEFGRIYNYVCDSPSENAVLPWSIAKRIGMGATTATSTTSGMILELRDRFGESLSLARLNDEGLKFEQIADVIDYFL